MPKHFNYQRQKETRRYLRRNETEAEKILWSRLRNRQMLGYKFRRQHGIDHFIMDFYCPEKRLAIEVDGVTHYSSEELEHDKARDDVIKKYGIRIIRVTNIDVYKNLDGVLDLIGEELQKISTKYYE